MHFSSSSTELENFLGVVTEGESREMGPVPDLVSYFDTSLLQPYHLLCTLEEMTNYLI
jgi:hypothetical protein